MSSAWPYPQWVAHRGAGKLAPENTLASFELGARHGYRMFECDVKLSADGVPFLLHDATLDRTTNGQGPANALTWAQLAALDAGSWHSPAFQGEPLARLDAVARFCLDHGYFLNIEIKPSPGQETLTGQVVADAAAQLWQDQAVPPLLTSFSTEALASAQQAQPTLPRGLLLDSLWDGWWEAALQLGCRAVVCHQKLWTAALVRKVQAAGLKTLSYTVNEDDSARRLMALGTDAIITDRVDCFSPDRPF